MRSSRWRLLAFVVAGWAGALLLLGDGGTGEAGLSSRGASIRLPDARSLMVARVEPAASVADGFVAAARRSAWCRDNPDRMVRSGPNKYSLGWCVTAGTGSRGPRPRRRLLPEASFASFVADDTCGTERCKRLADDAGVGWVMVRGRTGVRPVTTARCPRYKNIDFAADEPVEADRLVRTVPKGSRVIWRYASRGGGWVMAHWGAGGRYAWAFIPRACVPDPPTWSEIGLWQRRGGGGGGIRRPGTGQPFRVVRRALPCPSRLRCHAVDQRRLG